MSRGSQANRIPQKEHLLSFLRQAPPDIASARAELETSVFTPDDLAHIADQLIADCTFCSSNCWVSKISPVFEVPA